MNKLAQEKNIPKFPNLFLFIYLAGFLASFITYIFDEYSNCGTQITWIRNTYVLFLAFYSEFILLPHNLNVMLNKLQSKDSVVD